MLSLYLQTLSDDDDDDDYDDDDDDDDDNDDRLCLKSLVSFRAHYNISHVYPIFVLLRVCVSIFEHQYTLNSQHKLFVLIDFNLK